MGEEERLKEMARLTQKKLRFHADMAVMPIHTNIAKGRVTNLP